MPIAGVYKKRGVIDDPFIKHTHIHTHIQTFVPKRLIVIELMLLVKLDNEPRTACNKLIFKGSLVTYRCVFNLKRAING